MSAAPYSSQEIHLITSGAQFGLSVTDIVGHLAAHGFRRSRDGVAAKLRELGRDMPRENGWTQAHDAVLRQGLAAGLTFRAIAARLAEAGRPGTTRSATIGRAARLGLQQSSDAPANAEKKVEAKARPARRRVTHARPDVDRPAAALHRPAFPAVAELPVLVAPPPSSGPHLPSAAGCGLMGLTATTCRWPQGDPRDGVFHFCGAGVRMGSPYCAAHHSMAYVPAPDRRARRAPDAARLRPATAVEREPDCVELMAGAAA